MTLPESIDKIQRRRRIWSFVINSRFSIRGLSEIEFRKKICTRMFNLYRQLFESFSDASMTRDTRPWKKNSFMEFHSRKHKPKSVLFSWTRCIVYFTSFFLSMLKRKKIGPYSAYSWIYFAYDLYTIIYVT